MVLISSPKDDNVTLGKIKTLFKNYFKHQKKSFLATTKKFKKKDNNNYKQRDEKGKANKPNPKVKLDGNCNFCVGYSHKEFDCYKKKKEEKNKGNGNMNNFKGKKNIKASFIFDLYSMNPTFLTDRIVESECTNHLCFKNNKFENFHKHRKDAIMISDNSILKLQGIESMLIHGRVFEIVLYVFKLCMNLLSII